MNKGDWNPYYASPIVITCLLEAGIEPALCWVANIGLSDGRTYSNGKVVAIWDADLAAFKRAVPKRERVPVSLAGSGPKLNLIALRDAEGE